MRPDLVSIATTDVRVPLAEIGVVLLLVTIGFMIMLVVRKHYVDSQESSSDGFTLHELREMRARGELSDEEYEATREALIGAVVADRGADGSVEGSGSNSEDDVAREG